MNETAGRVFSITKENAPVPGCTISKAVSEANGVTISHFSLGENTDISAEQYAYHKLWFVDGGSLETTGANTVSLKTGDLFVTPVHKPIGVRAMADSVYTEISLTEDTEMNDVLKAGQIFALKDLLPYQDGSIVNMDLINNDHLKFVIMSFDAGTGLQEHAAPGEALIFALDGEAIITYEGKDHLIKAGENFKFDKLGKHAVTAEKPFKMALLLQLD